MADRKPDESRRPADCPREGSIINCPHMSDDKGDWETEWYTCDTCGASVTLYYDEMR